MYAAALAFLKQKAGPYGVAIGILMLMAIVAIKVIALPVITMEAVALFGICGAVGLGLGITYFVARNTREQSIQATSIYLTFGNNEPIHLTEDHHMPIVLELTADQQVTFEGFEAFDRTGGPVPVANPVLSVITEGAFEIIEVDGVKKLRPFKQGICQFKVGADPVPEQTGEPGEVFGYFEINVVPGVARTIAPKLGAVEDIPTE